MHYLKVDMTRIYVDLDGVLADFDKQYDEMFGTETRYDPILWKNIESVPDWFANLPMMEDAQELIDFVSIHPYGWEVLTATGHKYEENTRQKTLWCEQNLPRVKVNTVPKGVDKAKYVRNKWDILIDDTPKVIKAWVDAGGTGILHTSAKDSIRQLQEFLNPCLSTVT